MIIHLPLSVGDNINTSAVVVDDSWPLSFQSLDHFLLCFAHTGLRKVEWLSAVRINNFSKIPRPFFMFWKT
jgi:hypothetical protein